MLWALIMAGGWGTRLWPLSTQKNPKPFLKILPGGKSLFEESLRRVRKIVPNDRIFVIGNEKHLAQMRRQGRGLLRNQMIGEPEAKNTAPTVALAAHLISEMDPFATLLVLPADHLICNENQFKIACQKAQKIANQNQSFCIFGVKPSFPADSYGYLEQGRKVCDGIFELKRFVEKPSRKKAQQFLKTGRFHWHAGIFLAPVQVILESVEKAAPKILSIVKRLTVKNGTLASRKAFAALPNISVDYAILEKLKKAHMVAGKFDWCDVGTWKTFELLWARDSNGNARFGNLAAVDSKSNIVYSPKKKMVLFGVENLVVIDTSAATLIAQKDVSESMRKLVDCCSKGK